MKFEIILALISSVYLTEIPMDINEIDPINSLSQVEVESQSEA